MYFAMCALLADVPGEDKYYDKIKNQRDDAENGHDVAINGLDKVERSKPGCGINYVTFTFLQTSFKIVKA